MHRAGKAGHTARWQTGQCLPIPEEKGAGTKGGDTHAKQTVPPAFSLFCRSTRAGAFG